MKIVTILGARPQFIKAAAVSRVISRNNIVTEVIIHTGQHFDFNMSGVFFAELGIPTPKYHLDVNNCSHGAMTARMLEKIESILLHEKPDWVVVYGDTNSTLAGALAASKLNIKLAHIEAGLRSFNMKMPEEQNRVITDHLSTLLFCPSKAAQENLQKEGLPRIGSRIHVTGDVMYDAVLFHANQYSKEYTDLPKKFALCTIHRAENTDTPKALKDIVMALNRIHREQIPVILPLHPRTRLKLQEYSIPLQVNIIEPQGYQDMLNLIRKCDIVLTDSGGLQKEAYFMKKPCVTLRNETEWVELVKAGANIIAGQDEEIIFESTKDMLKKNHTFCENIYGDGKSSEKIIEELLR